MERFELTAAVVLFRRSEILVMKRALGFSAGGWFFPGGHLERGERPGTPGRDWHRRRTIEPRAG
jgi:8-oxo-dGTP pyrophosphatase MutT (NUDIX family)